MAPDHNILSHSASFDIADKRRLALHGFLNMLRASSALLDLKFLAYDYRLHERCRYAMEYLPGPQHVAFVHLAELGANATRVALVCYPPHVILVAWAKAPNAFAASWAVYVVVFNDLNLASSVALR